MPALAPAQTAMPLETSSMPNGRSWPHMSSLDRAVWVWGFQSGVMATLGSTTKDGEPIVSESRRTEIINHYFSNLSRQEIAKGIDRFYDAPENAPIDAASAVQYVTLKVSGAQQWELDAFAAGLRKARAQ